MFLILKNLSRFCHKVKRVFLQIFFALNQFIGDPALDNANGLKLTSCMDNTQLQLINRKSTFPTPTFILVPIAEGHFKKTAWLASKRARHSEVFLTLNAENVGRQRPDS